MLVPKAPKKVNQVPPPPPPSLSADNLTEVMESTKRIVIYKLIYPYFHNIIKYF